MQASMPPPPYYAVIFTSELGDDHDGYEETAELMLALAKNQPGFLGVESARNKTGITVSYWKDLESIRQWKEHPEHRKAQETGRRKWYKSFTTRVARVERES